MVSYKQVLSLLGGVRKPVLNRTLSDLGYGPAYSVGNSKAITQEGVLLRDMYAGESRCSLLFYRGVPCYRFGPDRVPVSLLLAAIFLPEPTQDEYCVRYRDADLKNYHLSNLEWAEYPYLQGDALLSVISRYNEGIKLRVVPNFPCYIVSEFGRVWTSRLRSEGHQFKELKVGVRDNYRISLVNEQGVVRTWLGRVVCESFNGPAPEDKPFALHWDDNRDNNHYTNLRWGTTKENKQDSIRNGTCAKGDSIGVSKLSEADVREIRYLYSTGNWTFAGLGRKFGVSYVAVREVVKFRVWKHIK